MRGFKRILPVSVIVLVIVFFVEALVYMEKERVRTETYALRDELIMLKLRNRELKIEIERLTDVKAVQKWAVKNGFTEKWSAAEAE